jgi:hypothetical protein
VVVVVESGGGLREWAEREKQTMTSLRVKADVGTPVLGVKRTQITPRFPRDCEEGQERRGWNAGVAWCGVGGLGEVGQRLMGNVGGARGGRVVGRWIWKHHKTSGCTMDGYPDLPLDILYGEMHFMWIY